MSSMRIGEFVAPGLRLMCWRSKAMRILTCLLVLSILIGSFASSAEALTSGLELSPAKMSLDRPVYPGDRIELKKIKVTNKGDSPADITITPHGAAKTDVTTMRLDPGVSSWFEAWLEIPEDISEGKHKDTIDVKAQGADKMNNVMLQVLIGYETTAPSLTTQIVKVVSDKGIYVVAVLFVLVVYYWVKTKRRARAVYKPQPAPLAARLHSVVQPSYAPPHPTPYYNPHPYVPSPTHQQTGPFQATKGSVSLSERLAAYRRQEERSDET